MFQALICGNSLLILIHHYLICTCFSEFSLLRSLRSVGGVEYIMLRTLQIFDLWNRLLHVPAGASKSWEAVITATRKELKTQSLRTLSSLAGPFHGPARSLGAQPPVREHFFSVCPYQPALFWWLHAGTASSSVSALLCWVSGCELRAGEQFLLPEWLSLFPVRHICLRLQPATDRPAGDGWRPGDRWDVWFRFFATSFMWWLLIKINL